MSSGRSLPDGCVEAVPRQAVRALQHTGDVVNEAALYLRAYSDATMGKPYSGSTMAEARAYQKGMRAIPGIREAQNEQLVRLGVWDRKLGRFVHAEPGVGKGHDGEGL